jgi:hypothetical protein
MKSPSPPNETEVNLTSEGDEADGEHSSLLIVPPTEGQ